MLAFQASVKQLAYASKVIDLSDSGRLYVVVTLTPACRTMDLGSIGRVWEELGSGQSPLQPVDALLRRAVRWVMLRCLRTILQQQAAILSYTLILSHALPYFLIKSRHQPYCPRMRRNAASAATHNIATAGGNTPKNSQTFPNPPNTSHQSRHLLVQSAER